jgi:hypothetical protein
MPTDKRGGLHNRESLAPVKTVREPDQSQTGSISGASRLDMALLVQGELFAQEEVFCCKYRSWTQTEAQETTDINQKRE